MKTPLTDAYIGTHETHRINGRTIYEHAAKMERELLESKNTNIRIRAERTNRVNELKRELNNLKQPAPCL